MSKGEFAHDYGRSPAVLPVNQWAEETVRRIQGRPEIRVNLLEGYDKVDFRVLSIFTHNYYDYSNPDNEKSKVICGYVEYLEELGRRYEVIPATLERIRQAYVEHGVGQRRDDRR